MFTWQLVHRAILDGKELTGAYADVAEQLDCDESTVGRRYRRIQELIDRPSANPERSRYVRNKLGIPRADPQPRQRPHRQSSGTK